MSGLQLEQISCRTLRQLQLQLADGEAVAILGPSGAGKSTLLKVIAGLLPHEGQVRLDGRPINQLPPHRRAIGYLSQELHLFPHLTVAQNLLLPLVFNYRGPESRRQRVQRMLALTQASHLATLKPPRLSGGERQRAALARCLVIQPCLLLLDEPFSALDHDTRSRLWHEFNHLRRHTRLTTLMVTHDPDEAQLLADRTLELRAGALQPQAEAAQPRGGCSVSCISGYSVRSPITF